MTAWKFDPAHTSIEFTARHMMVAKVRGTFTNYTLSADIDEANLANSKGRIEIEAASVETGQPDRDNHLRSADFFDAENHPKIVFETKSIEHKGDNEYRLVGDLTIRGVTHEVVFEGEAHGPFDDPFGGRRIGLSAEAKVNRKDWGLTWNMPFGADSLTVSDKVTLSIDAELVPAE